MIILEILYLLAWTALTVGVIVNGIALLADK